MTARIAAGLRGAARVRSHAMLRLVRIGLQLVLFFLLLSTVVGVASGATGAVEKIALAAIAGVLVWLAPLVRRIGAAQAEPRVIA